MRAPGCVLIRKPERLTFRNQRETFYILRQPIIRLLLLYVNGSKAPLKPCPGVRASFCIPSILIWLIKMHEISSHSATPNVSPSQPRCLVTILFINLKMAAEPTAPWAPPFCPPIPTHLSYSVLLNLNRQLSSDRHSKLGGEGGRAIYNPALFALRTRPFFPGHLPEPHSPGSIYGPPHRSLWP